MRGYPQFSFWISVSLAKICFPRFVINKTHKNTSLIVGVVLNYILFIKCFQVTDASLLMITGFPAFAVGDESLCQQAKDMVLEKLEVATL